MASLAAAKPGAPGRSLSRRLLPHLVGYSFVGPAVLVLCSFIVYPVIYSTWLSFHEWNGFSAAWGDFVGLDNYVRLAQDEIFWKAAVNSVVFVLGRTPVEVGIGFALALMLNQKIKGRSWLRTMFFVPVVMSLIVVTIIFQRIFEPQTGLLNTFLRTVGLGELAHPWLGDPSTAMATVVLISVWKNVGFSLVILLAGLQTLPGEVLEAARVDGASTRHLILRVITPLMKPVIGITVVLSVISGLKVFDLIFILTRGGPTYSTEVFATMLYREAFELNNMGLASAIAVIMVLFIMGTARLQTILLKDND